MKKLHSALTICAAFVCWQAQAQAQAQAQPSPPKPAFDAELAKTVGADDYGMRGFVLVVLKTGPTPMPAGKERDEMFKGHFANINRLAAEGKLVIAGPFDGVNGWRGLFVLAVTDIEEAKRLTQTDPVISSGEMFAEFHKYYGSAALMLVNDAHHKVAKKSF
jgi:uncharacterized protein YciI